MSARDERGSALLLVLLALVLCSTLSAALILTAGTETAIAANHRDSLTARYAADAVVDAAMGEVAATSDWNALLESADGVTASAPSSFHGSGPISPVTLSDNQTADLARATFLLNCQRTAPCSAGQMDATTAVRPWGRNNPRFHVFAWGWLRDLVGVEAGNGGWYVGLWIADDQSENDDDPSRDGGVPADGSSVNPGAGALTLHGEAFGPKGAHHGIDVTLARPAADDFVRRVRILSWRDVP